ncbi:MAG: lipocalin family protein [Bacteroidetes bacterium]|nr:lipocalin family protein [Bacteroidota bacterium]
MFGCKQYQKLETVASVDLARYAGKWYEIASYPTVFQKGCTNTSAEYTLTDKAYVKVYNSCNKDSVEGIAKSIEGKAFVVKNTNNTKLKVQFFWPFKGSYWIIGLADDYSWAVVSHPSRKYLWILSRTPQMDETLYKKILELIVSKGLDPNKLRRTAQKI